MPDATQPGVSGLADLNDPAKTFSRTEAMNIMRARRRETVVADIAPEEVPQYKAAQAPLEDAPAAAGNDEDSDGFDRDAAIASLTGTEPTQDETQQQLDTQTSGPRVLADDELANTHVRIKVNGVEREVSLAELRATAQKTAAADEYLERAKSTLAEVNNAARQLAAQATPTTTPSSEPEPRDTSDGPDPLDKFVETLFQGDEAAAKEHLRKFVGERKTTAATSDPEHITSQVEQRIVIRSALRAFAKDHKDIVDDPIARDVANRFIAQELTTRGASRLEELPADVIPDVYDAAGRATRDYFKQKAGIAVASAQPRVAVQSDRRAQKRSIDEPATASTRSSSSEKPPATTTDVINRMRQARGQPVPQ